MNWINLQMKTLRSPEYIGSDPLDRATWLNVLAHCCEQENAGRIKGASQWKDRQWQQVCGVTLREVRRAAKLIQWDGDDLLVVFYPLETEIKLADKRETARVNGMSGGRPKKPDLDIEQEPTLKPTLVSDGNQAPKAKGKERKGRDTPIVPEPSPSAPEGEKKDVKPTSPEAKAIARLFGRGEETRWSDKEINKFRDGVRRGVINLESVEKISVYYQTQRSLGDQGRHRRDLGTFLNNFDGELDRANSTNGNGNHAPYMAPLE